MSWTDIGTGFLVLAAVCVGASLGLGAILVFFSLISLEAHEAISDWISRIVIKLFGR